MMGNPFLWGPVDCLELCLTKIPLLACVESKFKESHQFGGCEWAALLNKLHNFRSNSSKILKVWLLENRWLFLGQIFRSLAYCEAGGFG